MNLRILVGLTIVWLSLIRPVYADAQIQDGRYWVYDNEGIIMSLLNYKELKRDGFALHYYKNGAVRLSEEYTDDRLDGQIREYREDISVLSKTKYKNGLRQGAAQRYYPNGRLEVELSYDRNKPHGISVVFAENGFPKQAVQFDHGVMTKVLYFDDQGNPTETK